MGILDTGSAAPTYVEPGEDRRQAGLFGLQMAQPFIQSYQRGLELGERQRQFDLEAPLRQAQASSLMANVDLAKARLDGITLDNQAQMAKRDADLQFQAGIANALSFEAGLNGDYSPANKAKAMEMFSRNPKLAFAPDGQPTPFFKGLMQNFDASEKLRARAELESEKQKMMAERAQRIAEIRAEVDQERAALGMGAKRANYISDRMKSGATPLEAAAEWQQSEEAANATLFKAPSREAAVESASRWAEDPKNRGKKALLQWDQVQPDKTVKTMTDLVEPIPFSVLKKYQEDKAAKAAADAKAKADAVAAEKEARKQAQIEQEQFRKKVFPKGIRLGY